MKDLTRTERLILAAAHLYQMITTENLRAVLNALGEKKITRPKCITIVKNLAARCPERIACTDGGESVLGGALLTYCRRAGAQAARRLAEIQAAQRGKPRYLPPAAELLHYLDPDYTDNAYKAVLEREISAQNPELSLSERADLIGTLELLLARDFNPEAISRLFKSRGYAFSCAPGEPGFDVLRGYANHLRIPENNAMTPKEHHERYEQAVKKQSG